MLIKKILLLLIFFHTITYSKLVCYIGEKDKIKYDYELINLKIDNNDIYKAYLLATEDEILIADNEFEILPLASITKLITAMVVIDNINNLDEIVKIDSKAYKIPYGVKPSYKKTYTVNELLKIMLISSSNSAAQALADKVSNNFIKKMNEKAVEIGAYTSEFCTPHGLPPKYTNTCLDKASAYDVYLISKYAINNYEIIREIINTENILVNGHKLKNTNDLLSEKNIKGTKTGYHSLAGYNISILFEKDNIKLYEIILGSDSSKNRSKISKEVLKQFGVE